MTYATGGSPEIINDNCGLVVHQHDINAVVKAIEIAKNKPGREAIKRSNSYMSDNQYKYYYDLYVDLMDRQRC